MLHLGIIIISILTGFILSNIPWGDSHFHGQGIPFPVVIFDKGKDYVGGLGIILNILFAICFIYITYGLYTLMKKKLKK